MEKAKTRFFKLCFKRCAQDEYWAYDTTSISSYSQANNMVRYGKNKDGDSLPQLNCLLVFGQSTNLPVLYRMLPGNVSDVSTLHECLTSLDCKSSGFIMDRGFYSRDNINELYRTHSRFIVGAKTSISYISKIIREKAGEIKSWNNYSDNYKLYAHCEMIDWNYEQVRPYKEDTLKEKRRMYVRVYYNATQKADTELDFLHKLHIAEKSSNQENRRKKSAPDFVSISP